MAIHEEAAHVTDADVPDELDGGRSEVPLSIFTGSEAFKKKAPSNRPFWDAHSTTVSVCFCSLFWGFTLHETWQNLKDGYVCSYS